MATPLQRELAKLRKAKGLTKHQPLSFLHEGKLEQNVEIPDINHGAWSMIDQPYAPDFQPQQEYDFL